MGQQFPFQQRPEQLEEKELLWDHIFCSMEVFSAEEKKVRAHFFEFIRRVEAMQVAAEVHGKEFPTHPPHSDAHGANTRIV